MIKSILVNIKDTMHDTLETSTQAKRHGKLLNCYMHAHTYTYTFTYKSATFGYIDIVRKLRT